MAFTRKYYTEFGDPFGNSWEIRLLEDAAVIAEEIVAGEPPCEFRWEGEGQFPYAQPIRGSQCTYTILAQESGVEGELEDILEAAEGTYRLELWKNGALWWRGGVLPELSSVAYQDFPRAYRITATCGLGRLQGLDYLDGAGLPYSGRDSKLDVILACLNKLGFLLGITTSDDWFSEDMAQGAGDDPLEQADVERSVFKDDKGNVFDCYEVVRNILAKKSLILMQSAGRWWLVQRQQLAKDLITVCHYTYDGSFQSTEDIDPRVVFDNSTVRFRSGADIPRASPVRGVEITYYHGEISKLIENGSFEDWDYDSLDKPTNPTDWLFELGAADTGRIQLSGAREGISAARMSPFLLEYGQTPDPDTLTRLAYYGGQVIVPVAADIRLSFSASGMWLMKNLGNVDLDPSPRPAFLCLRVGDYCVQKDASGTWAWIESSADIWNQLDVPPTWQDFQFETNPVLVTGSLSVFLTQIVDDRLVDVDPDNSNVDVICWDAVRCELVVEEDAEDNKSLTTLDEVTDSEGTVWEELGTVYIGDGPTSLSDSRITVAGEATSYWTRKGLSDNLGLDQLNTRMVLRSVWKPNKLLRASLIGEYEPHQSIILETGYYALNGASFNPKDGEWTGEWREVRDDAGAFETSESREKRTGFFSSGIGHNTILTQFSTRIGQLTSSREVTSLSANLIHDVAITQIPINVIGEHLFDAGDTLILVNLKNASVVQLTVSQNQLAGDDHIHINSWTPDEDWYEGSVIYQSDKKLLSMIIQNENAIILRVQYGEVLSQFTVEAESITADTNVFKSGSWDGDVDSVGHIVTPGTQGWAITGYGEAEFHSVNARGLFKTSDGTKRVELRASDNELEFFEGGVSKVKIGSGVLGSAFPGLEIQQDGIVRILSSANTDTMQVARTTGSGVAIAGFSSAAGVVNNFGIAGYATGVTTGAGENRGVYGTASGGATNWAGYFDAGNVYIANQIKIAGGVPGAGKVLTSDAAGLATWEIGPASGGWSDDGVVVRLVTATDQVVIGANTGTGKVNIISTTEQLRLGFDVDNYLSATISNVGLATFTAVGSAPKFAFMGGNFGIGTTDPWATLEVAKSNTATLNLYSTSADNAGGLITFKSGFTSLGNPSDILAQILATPDLSVGGRLVFFTSSNADPYASTERMRINAVGNTGFGLTTGISARVHVQSTSEQLRLGYDASIYAQFTSDGSGNLNVLTTGQDFVLGTTATTAYKTLKIIRGTVASASYDAYGQMTAAGTGTFGGSWSWTGYSSGSNFHWDWLGSANMLAFRYSSTGIGLLPEGNARLEVQSTSEQIRASFDVNNYLSITQAGAGGNCVFAVTGGGIFAFSNSINVGSASTSAVFTESYNAIAAPGTLGVGIPVIGTNIITGVLAINNTAAASSAPKMSPAVQLKHFSWNPTAGASQENSWYMVNWGFQTTGTAGGVLAFVCSRPSDPKIYTSFVIDEIGRTLIGYAKSQGSNYYGFYGEDFGTWGIILASSQPVVVGWPENGITTDFRVTGNTTLSGTANAVGTITSGIWQGTAIVDTYLATISTAGKVSGSAITSGNIYTSGSITSTATEGIVVGSTTVEGILTLWSPTNDYTGVFSVATLTLGRAWTMPNASGTVALVGHVHAASDVTSGTFADSYLATISTAGKVSGSAITSGNIHTSGSITSTAPEGIVVGSTTQDGTLTLWSATNDYLGVFSSATLTSGRAWVMPNASGTIITTGNFPDLSATYLTVSGGTSYTLNFATPPTSMTWTNGKLTNVTV